LTDVSQVLTAFIIIALMMEAASTSVVVIEVVPINDISEK
jgi:hypothetical protein